MMMEVWDKQVVAAVDVPFHENTDLVYFIVYI